MVAIQTTRRQRLGAAAQHPIHYLVVSAAAGHHRQSHIGPELLLAAKPVRRAHHRDQLRHAHRPQPRHTHEPEVSGLPPHFFDHRQFGFMPQRLERRQLLIQEAGPLFRSWLRQFPEPLPAPILPLNLMAPAGNRPPAKYGLQAIHHARRVAHQAVVGAHQLLQRPHPVVTV